MWTLVINRIIELKATIKHKHGKLSNREMCSWDYASVLCVSVVLNFGLLAANVKEPWRWKSEPRHRHHRFARSEIKGKIPIGEKQNRHSVWREQGHVKLIVNTPSYKVFITKKYHYFKARPNYQKEKVLYSAVHKATGLTVHVHSTGLPCNS